MPTRRLPSGACSACFATPRSRTCRVCFETANTTWSPPMAATAGRPRRGVCRFSTSSCCTCARWTATGSASSIRTPARSSTGGSSTASTPTAGSSTSAPGNRARTATRDSTRPAAATRTSRGRVRPVELQATMAHAAGVLAFFAAELGLSARHTPLASDRDHVSRPHPTALRPPGRALPRLGRRRRARRGRRRAVLGDRSAALLRAVADAAADRRATGRSRDSAALLPAVDAVAVVDHHTRRVGCRGWPVRRSARLRSRPSTASTG